MSSLQFPELIIFLVFTAYLLLQYAAKSISCYIKLLVYVSWLISFSFIIVLPIDIYYAWHYESQYNEEVFNKIKGYWRFFYWSQFLLSWIILPFFQEYEDAGEFQIKDKIKRSIKNNLMLYGIMVLVGILTFVYLAVYKTVSMSNISTLTVSLTNLFGLLLIVVLLSYGLVKIPKKKWISRNFDLQLKYNYFQVAQADEDQKGVKYNLQELLQFIEYVSEKYNGKEEGQICQNILCTVPHQIKSECLELQNQEALQNSIKKYGVINLSKVYNLHKQLKMQVQNYKRLDVKIDNMADQALLQQELLSKKSYQEMLKSELWLARSGKISSLIDKIVLLWHLKYKKYYYSIIAIFTLVLSIYILIGQLLLFTKSKFGIFHFYSKDNNNKISVQVSVSIPLIYMSYCIFYGLFNMKVAGFFGLYRNQNTDSPSLLFGSINFMRVSAPICANFIDMIKVSNTAFDQVIGKIDFIPILGSATFFFFPLILVLFSLFNLFDIYSRILNIFGLKQFQFNEQFNDNLISDGNDLVNKIRSRTIKILGQYKSKLKSHGFVCQSKLKNYVREDGNDLEQIYKIDKIRSNSSSTNSKSSFNSKQCNFMGFNDIMSI